MRRAITLGSTALVAVIVMGSVGCGIKTGQHGVPTPVLERDTLQSAPQWVKERLAQAAHDVYFDLNEDLPHATERDALARSAPELNSILRDFPDLVIVIEGHCDDRGSREYNLQLGKRRAATVRQILVSAGFPSLHLRTVSIGDTRPLCLTDDEACRQKNRRVHLRAAKVPGEER